MLGSEGALADPSWVEGLYEATGSMELAVFIGALLLSVTGLVKHFPLSAHRLWAAVPNPGLGLVRAALLFSGAWFTFVFITGAASDIVGFYIAFYVAFAYACLLLGGFSRPILGLYYRGEVVERQNLAAGIVVAGFVLGTAFAFGGALTGEGPGWIVVLVFFLLAYFELRANVALVSRISGSLATAVRADRDVSAGILLAGVSAASGLIAGRAAAGDFLGWEVAMQDYLRRLWPLPIVPIVASVAGFFTQESPKKLAARTLTAVALVLFGAFFYFFT